MPGGQLNLAFASTAALQASLDHLMVFRFKVLPGATASTALNFSKVLFNEAIKAHIENGSFGPKILPVLSISPASVTMVAGDTLTFTASNGHEPYIWDTSDHRVARVNEEGRLIRSEEHTSELQSRPHLVCRLLLEKKKKNREYITVHKTNKVYSRELHNRYKSHALTQFHSIRETHRL